MFFAADLYKQMDVLLFVSLVWSGRWCQNLLETPQVCARSRAAKSGQQPLGHLACLSECIYLFWVTKEQAEPGQRGNQWASGHESQAGSSHANCMG